MSEPAPSDARGWSEAAWLDLLERGTLEILGRLSTASNVTLCCRITLLEPTDGPREAVAIYKPVRGEAPLWDFPVGTLANRERAAYLVSEAIGWSIVPPTVLRDGPFGRGMVQLWIDADERADLGRLVTGDAPPLRRMAVFDAIVNNADRKGGHLLPVAGGHVYGVDHGVCFHHQPKLRTVLWRWRGRRFETDELAALGRVREGLAGRLGSSMAELLTRRELAALRRRVDALIETGSFPQPNPDWPAIPWPPF